MKGEIPIGTLNEYIQMGFSEQLIQMGWQQAENEHRLMDTIIQLNERNQKLISDSYTPQQQQNPVMAQQDDEMMLNQVIMDSLKTNQGQSLTFETMNPSERKRQDGCPVGLKNVGNTCYFNSLLQTYFFNSHFVKAIIDFTPPENFKELLKENSIDQKMASSIHLVMNLQHLFVSLIGSEKKYVDPTDVVKSICDDFGNHLPIGDQKDVGEFNHYFLSRVDEGLNYSRVNSDKMNEESPLQSPIRFNDEESVTSSILRQKSHILGSQSLVSKFFFGQYHQVFEFQQGEQMIIRESQETFNFIPLDVQQNNLYDALDHHLITHIEEFRNDQNQTVKAQKYNWIKRPPQTLFFQIQRVHFDKQKCNQKRLNKQIEDLVKLNQEFLFDEEIFIDRFLFQHHQEYLEIRKRVFSIKEEQKKYTNFMHQLTNFKNKIDLMSGLNDVSEFLSLQSKPNDQSPLYFGPINFQTQQLKQAEEILQTYGRSVNERFDYCKKHYDVLEKQVQSSYNNLRKEGYTLSSILIHDGFANSGHYYAYIHDNSLNKWIKFNDIHTQDIDVNTVIKNAVGGNLNTNAYLLVYVRNDIAIQDKSSMIPMRKYRTSQSLSQSEIQLDEQCDKYTLYLSPQQKEQIKTENMLFLQEIEDYKISRSINNILDNYQQRFEFVNEQARLLKAKNEKVSFKPYNMLNLPIFVKLHPENQIPQDNKFENIIKILILDSSIREFHPDKSLLQPGIDNMVSQLKNIMKSAFKYPQLPITPQENQECQRFAELYKLNVAMAAKSVLMMESFLEKKWINASAYLFNLMQVIQMSQNIDTQNYYFRLCQNQQRLLPVSIFLYLEENLDLMDSKEVQQIFQQLKKYKACDIIGVLIVFISKRFSLFKDLNHWKVQMSILIHDLLGFTHSQLIKDQINGVAKAYDNDASFPIYDTILMTNSIDLGTQIKIFTDEYETFSWSMAKTSDVLFDRLIEQFDQIKIHYKNQIQVLDLIKKKNFPVMLSDRLQYKKK